MKAVIKSLKAPRPLSWDAEGNPTRWEPMTITVVVLVSDAKKAESLFREAEAWAYPRAAPEAHLRTPAVLDLQKARKLEGETGHVCDFCAAEEGITFRWCGCQQGAAEMTPPPLISEGEAYRVGFGGEHEQPGDREARILRGRISPVIPEDVARHHREYQRIVSELQELCGRANMAAAIMMTEFDEDGKPNIEDVGLESLRRVLAPLGYQVVKDEAAPPTPREDKES